VFSAGSRALLMICNVPEDKLTDTPAKEEGAPPMKAVASALDRRQRTRLATGTLDDGA